MQTLRTLTYSMMTDEELANLEEEKQPQSIRLPIRLPEFSLR